MYMTGNLSLRGTRALFSLKLGLKKVKKARCRCFVFKEFERRDFDRKDQEQLQGQIIM